MWSKGLGVELECVISRFVVGVLIVWGVIRDFVGLGDKFIRTTADPREGHLNMFAFRMLIYISPRNDHETMSI
jgi:hypothetical protein